MLQLGLAAALEVLAAICGEPIPESNRVLHSELVLECTQRRGGVVPVAPRASGQTVLHAT